MLRARWRAGLAPPSVGADTHIGPGRGLSSRAWPWALLPFVGIAAAFVVSMALGNDGHGHDQAAAPAGAAVMAGAQCVFLLIALLVTRRELTALRLVTCGMVVAGIALQVAGYYQTAVAEYNDVGALTGGRTLALWGIVGAALAGCAFVDASYLSGTTTRIVAAVAIVLTLLGAFTMPGVGAFVALLALRPASSDAQPRSAAPAYACL